MKHTFYKIGFLFGMVTSFMAQSQTVEVRDTLFLKFLKSSFAQTVTVDNKLIVAEAAKVRGAFVCKGLKISNVEELKYFTGISSIDVSDNNLANLPDLSALVLLRQLWAARNRLEYLPLLDQNTQLQELVVYGNDLKELPSLAKLVNLTYLDVVNNQLETLPELNNCNKLGKLLCRGNLLRNLPNIDSLKLLGALDLSYNRLQDVPNLSKNVSLETVNLNDNQIATLPDPIAFPVNVARVWIYDNYLTFSELNKMKTIPDYRNKVVYAPQFSMVRSVDTTILKSDTLKLASTIDVGVGGLQYIWLKNNQILNTKTERELIHPMVNYADSGVYELKISSVDFPGLTVTAYKRRVYVSNCIDLLGFSYHTSQIGCEEPGSVKIVAPNSRSYIYTMVGVWSGKRLVSTTGRFEEVLEPRQTLYIASAGCDTVRLPYVIELSKEDCKSALITPNADGNQDSYFIAESGIAEIYDKRGQLVKTMALPAYWDAHGDTGLVAQGVYWVSINNGAKRIAISVVY